MKIIKNYLVLLSVILIASCTVEDVEDRPVIDAIDAPVLAAPATGSSYSLTLENSTKLAERFVWSDANFGGDVAITYSVEIDVAGNGFENPFTLGSVISENSLGVNGETLNNAAIALGGEAGTASDFEVRVKATVGDISMLSNSAPIIITPYTTEIPKLYVVGNFLAASGYGSDWNPGDGVPLSASGPGNKDFEGFVYMNVDSPQFKFLPTTAGWNGDFGDSGETDGGYTGVIVPGGKNAGAPDGRGYYFVTVNTATLTYSLEKVNYGVIGSATPTGWDSDTAMVYDPQAKVWKVTMNLSQEQIKFRANESWNDYEFGDHGADGILEFKGANIDVPEAGNYTIVLDLSTPRQYTYSLNKN